MLQIVIATRNEGKIREIEDIVALSGVEFLTFRDFDEWLDVDEHGSSFNENAILKAKTLLDFTGLAVLADDSGLEVDALNGAPGILSARYAGSGCLTQDNNSKLLRELAGIPFERRGARFKCVAVLLRPGGKPQVCEGVCTGHIALQPRGSGGFGYDPLFVPDGFDKTVAELSGEEKNQISHRGKAFRCIKRELEKLLAEN